MITGYKLKDKVKVFARRQEAIAHPIRLSILYLLSYGKMTLGEIAANADYKENLIAHHMKILCEGGWVMKKKEGIKTYYTLYPRMIFDLFRLFQGTPFDREVIGKKLR